MMPCGDKGLGIRVEVESKILIPNPYIPANFELPTQLYPCQSAVSSQKELIE